MNFNKLMSIIIGTSISTSIVPLAPVNASVKLETLDGVIYEAKAFAGGKYVFEGYKNDDQDNAVYFFDGKNDIEIEDAESVGSKYGMNYINFKEDGILFNMITGQAEEDDEESKLAMMETKFKSSVVKKVDRYKNTQNLNRKGKIVEDSYCGVWYEYELTGNNTNEKYIVYLSDTGKYIDVSETLNIDYYTDNKKVTLKTYDDLDKNNLEAIFEKALILDQENIYKLIVIAPKDEITCDLEEEDNNGISMLNLDSSLKEEFLELLDAMYNRGATAYIQKISMEQGEKKDGAYLPKKVTSFETYDFNVVEFLINNILGNNTARVSGNNLYTINLNKSHDKITMEKYTIKKIKDKEIIENKTVDRRVLEFDEDFDYIIDEPIQDYDVDVTGNLWILNKGKIKKFENGKLETKYTVDRTINNLSVFTENSLIAWNTEDEIYSVVSPVPVVEDNNEEEIENSAEESNESNTEAELTSGWIKNIDGTWNFKKEDGNLATGWLKDNGTWYYLNGQGTMQTGWVKDGSTWYYLNSSGAMQTGWVKVESEWYYLNASGAMQTGWFKDINGKWYYLYSSGAMAYNTVIDGYKLDASGAWIQ